MRTSFDEMNGFGSGEVRAPYKAFAEWLGVQHLDTLRQKTAEAETLFRRSGITFAVYGAEEAGERLIPFDILPFDVLFILLSPWSLFLIGHMPR